jgi:hypothetical protein
MHNSWPVGRHKVSTQGLPMIAQYIISFCNNNQRISDGSGYLALLEVDLENQQVSVSGAPLVLPAGLRGNGITGMCHHEGELVILLQRMPSTLVFTDLGFNYLKHHELEGLKGVHTIISWQRSIYLSVTNQDRIVKLDPALKQQDVWSNQTLQDDIHLNSLCVHDGQLHASAFGHKAGQLWSSARQGYVFNVATGEQVINNIWHPHSSFSHAGKVYCCDSSNQQIISAGHTLLKDLPGYSRGLFINDEIIICGSSLGRLVSHSTGVRISNKSDQGTLGGQCGLTVHFRNSKQQRFVDLSDMATEVFEVLPLSVRD